MQMKKFFAVALMTSCFGFASAQWGTATSNSSSPSGLSPSVTSDADVHLTLYNAIEITPTTNWCYAALFMTAADYNGLTNAADMGTNTWYINSTKSFDISLQFTDLKSNPQIATVMPANKLSYSTDNGGTWNIAALSVPNVSSYGTGGSYQFDLKLKANPGWDFPGGFYAGRVIVTATQH